MKGGRRRRGQGKPMLGQNKTQTQHKDNIHIHKCTNMYTHHTQICIHICIYTHTQTHTHTHRHTHTLTIEERLHQGSYRTHDP